MLSKKKTQELVDIYSPLLIRMLQLDLPEIKIKFHVRKSLNRARAAVTMFTGKNKFDLIIYYNLQESKLDCVGSIFHELLHVKIDPLSSLTKNKKAYDIEEDIVQNLEKLFLALLDGTVVL